MLGGRIGRKQIKETKRYRRLLITVACLHRSYPRKKRHLNHGRRFTLHFANGKQLVVWLDQGWSYWAMAKQHRQTALATFNAHLPASNLGEALAEFRVDVEGHDLSTQVFVDRGAVF